MFECAHRKALSFRISCKVSFLPRTCAEGKYKSESDFTRIHLSGVDPATLAFGIKNKVAIFALPLSEQKC